VRSADKRGPPPRDRPNNPLIALVGSACDAQLAVICPRHAAWTCQSRSEHLDTADATGQADLLGALLIGVTVSRCVVEGGELASMSDAKPVIHLTSAIRAAFRPFD
jgi:hypothetical protein